MKKTWFIAKMIFAGIKKDIKGRILDYNRIYRLDKDLCIRVLKYGDDHREGFTFNEMKQCLWLDDNQAEYLRGLIKIGEVFKSVEYTKTENGKDVLKEKLLMTFKDKFRLMQYLEIKEAMKSSRRAMWIAILSIMIAVLLGSYQIFIGIAGLQR